MATESTVDVAMRNVTKSRRQSTRRPSKKILDMIVNEGRRHINSGNSSVFYYWNAYQELAHLVPEGHKQWEVTLRDGMGEVRATFYVSKTPGGMVTCVSKAAADAFAAQCNSAEAI